MEKSKIDWCDSTWNPVTGCMHECGYCYARRIAERFGGKQKYANVFVENEPVRGDNEKNLPYPHSFAPTFHRYRLDDYINKKGRNIFVCSMADLFGEWVPDSWIEEVFAACDKAPQHNYLFLTKNPERYVELLMKNHLPESRNMWYGATVTNAVQAAEAEMMMQDMSDIAGAFLSIEPILEDISYDIRTTIADFTDWVIIGAETGRRKNKVIPKMEWIADIVNACRKADIPVFMKSNLTDIWGEPLIQEFSRGLMR